jgi:adenine phosphoribosyltransferase
MSQTISDRLKAAIRQVPDFPKEGINFFDITTVLKQPALTREVNECFYSRYKSQDIQAVVGIEARGFIFGALLAAALDVPLVLARKPGKLPAETERIAYSLEYGEDAVEIHKDAIQAGDRVVIVDDLLATGGTVSAVIQLCRKLEAEVVECAFMIELSFLHPRDKLVSTPVFSLVEYHQ